MRRYSQGADVQRLYIAVYKHTVLPLLSLWSCSVRVLLADALIDIVGHDDGGRVEAGRPDQNSTMKSGCLLDCLSCIISVVCTVIVLASCRLKAV